MTIEQEARDLLAAYVATEGAHFAPLMAIKDALEQLDAERQAHADFRQRVSDAMELWQEWATGPFEWQRGDRAHFVELQGGRRVTFSDFIIPKPVDPLVEAIREMALTDATPEDAERLRTALTKRGLVIREEG